jgi:hypothetical protein
LPVALDIRGFGPVKLVHAIKAAKQREVLAVLAYQKGDVAAE